MNELRVIRESFEDSFCRIFVERILEYPCEYSYNSTLFYHIAVRPNDSFVRVLEPYSWFAFESRIFVVRSAQQRTREPRTLNPKKKIRGFVESTRTTNRRITTLYSTWESTLMFIARICEQAKLRAC